MLTNEKLLLQIQWAKVWAIQVLLVKLCFMEGKNSVYNGKTGEYMHVRYKSHLTELNLKKGYKGELSIFKHLENAHGGRIDNI